MSDDNYILVIEDDFLIALEMTMALEARGYHVAAVPSGEAALGEAAAHLPALALVDIKLRGERDGVETARELHDRHHVPVIFVTASADAETVQRASAAGPAGYMLKPFDPALLTRTVEAALG